MSARIKVVLFGPPGRGSFNESGHAGAQRARAAGSDVEVVWIEPASPQARTRELLALCARGADLVVAHGGQGDHPVSVAAERFPQLRFVVTQGSFISHNTASYEALQEQSAFLAGVLAASESRSGVVGHMSGEKVRPGLKGRAAFLDGVRRVAPEARALTTFCGNQHDPTLAFDTFAAQGRAGADIVFAMIDGGREGGIDACRRFGIRQIGNVLDWTQRDPDIFIASAVANSGLCVAQAIADFERDRIAYGTTREFGLADPEFVRLDIGKAVRPATRELLAQWSQRLIEGTAVPLDTYDGVEFDAVN